MATMISTYCGDYPERDHTGCPSSVECYAATLADEIADETPAPLGITYTPSTRTELAIVDVNNFARSFNYARSASPMVQGATAEVVEHVEDTTYRLSLDGMSGYAVRPNGELVYVFSLQAGRGDAMLRKATERDGATHLDCFDGYLTRFYARHGFTETKREPNRTAGGPDVVWMSRTDDYVATRVGILR